MRVPGPAEWEEDDSSNGSSQRVSELQAELNMLRQQMRGNMMGPPAGMHYPGGPSPYHQGEVVYGPGEMPYPPGDDMQPFPMEEGMVAPSMPSTGGWGPSCLGAVGPCCTNCSTCGPFSFGAEGVFLKPNFAGSEAFATSNFPTGLGPGPNPLATPGTSTPFDWDNQGSIRIWAAVKGCDGFGVRGRFWRLEGDETVTQTLGAGQFGFASVTRPNSATLAGVSTPGQAILLGAPGETMTATHSLDLATADLELVKDILFPRAMLTLAAGIRYTRNDQVYLVSNSGTIGGNLQHQHRFEGMGPTIAMELRRCLGCSGFSAYVNTRGSAIFGENDVWVGTPGAPNNYTANGLDETLLIGETAFGLQDSWHKLWIRGGYEVQYWMNAGNANTTGADMGLVGFQASAGLGF